MQGALGLRRITCQLQEERVHERGGPGGGGFCCRKREGNEGSACASPPSRGVRVQDEMMVGGCGGAFSLGEAEGGARFAIRRRGRGVNNVSETV